MRREIEGEELWVRFLIRFILIGSLLYFTIRIILTLTSPL